APAGSEDSGYPVTAATSVPLRGSHVHPVPGPNRPCPSADKSDRAAARVVRAHPEQGWSLLCNGVVLFDDGGYLVLDGHAVDPVAHLTAPDDAILRERRRHGVGVIVDRRSRGRWGTGRYVP